MKWRIKTIYVQPTDFTASDSDETLSVNFENENLDNSRAAIPYADDIGYRVEWQPRASADLEWSEPAPLSSNFVEDIES